MSDVETRECAYFVAVAEELHFGRAAARLGMAQPPLSRAIQALERRLGVLLLERSSRGTSLTPSGEVFLEEARTVLDAATAAVRRTRRAGHEAPRLRLVMKPDGDAGMLEAILPVYRRDVDAVEVEVVVCGIGEQARAPRDGRADVALLPASDPGLDGFDTEVLLTQGHVAVLSRHHRLVGRSALVMADLDGEPVPQSCGAGVRVDGGPVVRDVAQLLQLVALGQAVAVVPEFAQRHLRDDVVCVPLLDAPVDSLLLAWPERSRSRAVAALVRASSQVAARGAASEVPTPLTRSLP